MFKFWNSSVIIDALWYKTVFVDIDLETLQINIDQIEKKISKNTKAIMVPNLIGNILIGRKYF